MKSLFRIVLFVATLIVIFFPPIFAQSLASHSDADIAKNSSIAFQLGSWSTAAPMPSAKKQFRNSTVTLDGNIYVIGGVLSANGAITDAVDIYDPESDSWSSAASLPLPLWRSAAAVVNEKIYLFGGYRSTAGFPFSPSNQSFVYDPELNTWTEIASLSSTRGSQIAVAVSGQIHVIGGASSSASNAHDIYDPSLDEWTTAEPLPTARAGLAGNLVGNQIIVVGGYFLAGGVVSLSVVEAYDLETDSWQTLENMPTNRHGISAQTFDGKLIVFGGFATSPGSRVMEFDPESNTWRDLEDMPTPGVFMGTAVVQDRIYVFGGGLGGLDHRDAVDLSQVFTPPQ